MAMILDLVTRAPDDSELERITLATGASQVLKYVPRTPKKRSIEMVSMLRNGTRIQKTTYADVDETAEMIFEGATDDDITDYTRGFERAFEAAALRQESTRGPRVFLELQPDRMPLAFRSEIKRGDFNLEDEALSVAWRTRKLVIQPAWLRNYYWEAVISTALPMRSALTALTTAGVIVEGSLGRTWVEILGSNLPGVIPAPIRLEIKNLDPSLTAPSQIWVGRNQTASPTTLNPIIEAEDAASLYGNDIVVSAAYSNGNAVEITPPATAAASVGWDLDSAFLEQFSGGPVKVVLKLPSTNTLVWMKVRVKYFVTVLAEGPEVLQTNATIQDLGSIDLPPWNVPGGSTPQALTLELVTRSASPIPFVLDFIHLIPMDGFVNYTSRGYGLQSNITLVDDAINDTLTVTGGGETAGFFVKSPANDGLLMQPLADQRLYILQNVEDIDRQLQVQAWYKQRVLTL